MDYKLEDLVNISSLQSLQEKLYLISPFPTGIIDNEGKILTAVAWQDLCTNFLREHPKCEKECLERDEYIHEQIIKDKPTISYKCPYGLTNLAIPIIIEGKHLATFYIGQFFLNEPDINSYRQYAKNYGFEEETFLNIVKKVPVWSREDMDNRLAFVKEFIDIIALSGLKRLKEIESGKILKDSEERFKSIVESTDDFIWMVDPYDFTITTFNQSLYNYLLNDRGIDLKIGDTLQKFTGSRADEWTRFYEKALRYGKYETEYTVINGERILNLSLNTIVSGSEIIAISVFGKEITKLKQHESELIVARQRAEKREFQLKETHALAKMGSWEFDFTTGLFTFDENFLHIFQTTAEETGGYEMSVNEYVAHFIHPEDAWTVGEEIKKAITTDDPEYSGYNEHRIIRKDGSTGYLAVRFYIKKDASGRTIKSYGVNQDITAKKISEQELIKAKEKAEESNKLKSAFLMNMSHEIRTPMNGILGFMNLLKEPDLTEEDRMEFISLINKSGDRLMTTINDLIEISKIEIGDINIKQENVDLTEIMNFYYNFFKLEAEEKGLKFEITELITGTEADVLTDRHKLDSILTNLIKNAIKFTKKGSISISNKIENGKLIFSVTDTGKGIPKDKFETVFDRFYQVEMGGNRNHDGSGIGLSIVKAYIDALNGSIKIESEVGKGSSFIVSIPYTPAHISIKEEEETLTLNGNGIRSKILIAEDDEINFFLLDKVLGKEFEIVHAKSGEEAVNLFSSNSGISVILMDVKMPGKYDGPEAIRRIKKIDPKVPIIAQTAFTMDEHILVAIKDDCSEIITKPFNSKKLLESVKKYKDRISLAG